MRSSTRRTFLKRSGLAVAGATLATASSKALGANERVNLGVVGLSRGRSHCEAFGVQDDARLDLRSRPQVDGRLVYQVGSGIDLTEDLRGGAAELTDDLVLVFMDQLPGIGEEQADLWGDLDVATF